MTAPDTAPAGDTTPGSTPPAPKYKSPSDQLREALGRLGLDPSWGFQQLFEAMGNAKGGSGGRFEFSLAEMREMHRQFVNEVDALTEMTKKSFRLSQGLNPLAGDEASTDHHVAAQEHHGKLRGAIEQHLKFAEGFRDAIGASINLKAETEDSIGGSMNSIQGTVA